MSRNSSFYRPDIDGLRAIAIILVILFHAFPTFTPCGFMGVDIFFVISGYLISSAILRDLKAGSFSLLNFYGRRFRRIAPALILVLFATGLLGWLLLPSASFRALGKHLVAGATFTSNILLFKQSGYFDKSSSLKPLLHMWSLGIEEQFYLLWPLILMTAFSSRFARRFGVGKIILIILAASFAINLRTVAVNPSKSFYLLPSRFWELLAGCLLAYVEIQKKRLFRGRWFNEILAVLALFLLVISQIWFQKAAFPGWRAILPVLATFLLISAGPEAFLNKRVLSLSPFVLIGLISYPLYLWHWPLLSISRILGQTRTATISPWWILTASFPLAYLTWRWVEKPIQKSLKFDLSGFFQTPQFAIEAAAFCFVGIACFGVLIAKRKLPSLDSQLFPKAQALEDYDDYNTARSRQGLCFIGATTPNPTFNRSCYSAPASYLETVAILGDSYAAHLYPGVADLLKNFRVYIAQLTVSACPPLYGAEEFYGADQTDAVYCGQVSRFEFGKISALKPQVVILYGKWAAYYRMKNFGEHLAATINGLEKDGIKHVVVIGPPPRWTPSLPKVLEKSYMRRGLNLPRYTFAGLDRSIFEANDSVKSIARAHGAIFVSLTDSLCRSDGCLTIVGKSLASDLITYDSGHLTVPGADFVATRILGPKLLQALRLNTSAAMN